MKSIKPTIFLFTDGSVNPQSGVGFGAYLFLNKKQVSLPMLVKDIQTKKFVDTSSTKLELETLLWALSEIKQVESKIVVYTDCQNIIGLKSRRERFEKNDYITSKNQKIKNHELYKEFFTITDSLDCEFIKVKGHKKSSTKDEIDKIFSLVDKTARGALSLHISLLLRVKPFKL